MRLVIANEARRAELAICHLISNKREWNNNFLSPGETDLQGVASGGKPNLRRLALGGRKKNILKQTILYFID